jgi:hypothetical protein
LGLFSRQHAKWGGGMREMTFNSGIAGRTMQPGDQQFPTAHRAASQNTVCHLTSKKHLATYLNRLNPQKMVLS